MRAPMPSRRGLLRGTAALAATALLPRSLGATPFGALADAASNGRTLVLLELAGGNDGLNTLVPLDDGAYSAARGELAITDALPLAGQQRVGLHPALSRLAALHDAGRVALVEGVGYPEPQRSHFLSRDIWHTADLGGRQRDRGWIGRLSDTHFVDTADPNAVICLGNQVPYVCRARQHQAVALSSPVAYRVLGDDRLVESLDTAVSADQVSDRARAFLRKSYLDARASSDAVRKAAAAHTPSVDYPDLDLADDLKLVAGLLAGGLDTRVFSVSTGGFDTHTDQRNRHQRLLEQLDRSLTAFQADLEAHGLADDVLVLVYSEFGRRVKANGSGGTDHGTAGPVLLLGKAVQGGLHGAPPDLADLDDNGDLRYTTDFRRVYATLLERWFEVPSGPILRAETGAGEDTEGFDPLPLLT